MSELRKSCAWCHPAGSPGYDADASHGMCGRHSLELRARILKTRKPGVDARLLPEAEDTSGQAGHGGPCVAPSHSSAATAADTRETTNTRGAQA